MEGERTRERKEEAMAQEERKGSRGRGGGHVAELLDTRNPVPAASDDLELFEDMYPLLVRHVQKIMASLMPRWW